VVVVVVVAAARRWQRVETIVNWAGDIDTDAVRGRMRAGGIAGERAALDYNEGACARSAAAATVVAVMNDDNLNTTGWPAGGGGQ